MSQAIGQAFKQLCAVVRPRPDMAANMDAAASRLFKALGEYPEDVALWALDAWPRTSEWFPTEHELRVVCEQRMGEIAREGASKGEAPKGRFLHPIGKTRYFVERCAKVFGEPFVKSWLIGGVNCMFSKDTIYTTGVGAERLNKQASLLLQEAGCIVIKHSDCSAMLAKHCDQNGLMHEPKRSRR